MPGLPMWLLTLRSSRGLWHFEQSTVADAVDIQYRARGADLMRSEVLSEGPLAAGEYQNGAEMPITGQVVAAASKKSRREIISPLPGIYDNPPRSAMSINCPRPYQRLYS